MAMASKYHLTIRERYEDHSEDEFTGGVAVCAVDYEHKLDLDTAKTGETINVSYHTNIIIQSSRLRIRHEHAMAKKIHANR